MLESSGVALIIGFVAKRIKFIPNDWIPFVNLGIGLVYYLWIQPHPPADALGLAVVAAGTATGVHQGGKILQRAIKTKGRLVRAGSAFVVGLGLLAWGSTAHAQLLQTQSGKPAYMAVEQDGSAHQVMRFQIPLKFTSAVSIPFLPDAHPYVQYTQVSTIKPDSSFALYANDYMPEAGIEMPVSWTIWKDLKVTKVSVFYGHRSSGQAGDLSNGFDTYGGAATFQTLQWGDSSSIDVAATVRGLRRVEPNTAGFGDVFGMIGKDLYPALTVSVTQPHGIYTAEFTRDSSDLSVLWRLAGQSGLGLWSEFFSGSGRNIQSWQQDVTQGGAGLAFNW